MQIQGFDPGAEPDKVQTFYDLYLAGVPLDDPDGPPWSRNLYTWWIANGWSGEPRRAALATGDDGAVLGGCLVELPQRRNKHIGNVNLLVPPGQRRHGSWQWWDWPGDGRFWCWWWRVADLGQPARLDQHPDLDPEQRLRQHHRDRRRDRR